ELARIKAHIAEQGLKVVRSPADVDLALGGDPHVVLAVEGADFVEGDLARVKVAYDLGIRHLQLVHFIRNPIGDFQTEQPEHNGLTEFGRKVVLECNRLGILVDLAHSSRAATSQALAVAKVPLVWSHGSVTGTARPDWSMIGWRARQLTMEEARAIARAGGVIGLWALGPDVGRTIEAYAERMIALASTVGDDHAAFGTRMN